MYIIGINAYHADSSACIINNGELIAAVEEERFTRIKHYAGFPKNSIQYCLDICNIKLSDVKYVAINRDPKANNFKRIIYVLSQRPSFKLILDRFKNRQKYKKFRDILISEFKHDQFHGEVINIEHHYAHLSSCFHVSPYKNACLISVDGFGDFASSAWGYGNNGKISIDKKIHFPHSLGIFYQSMTQFLGFKNYGDEYKVMGLAPYGKPKYLNELKKILLIKLNGEFELNLDYFKFHRSDFKYTWDKDIIEVGDLYSENLEKLFGLARKKEEPIIEFHKDLAHSVQNIYEKAFINILNNLYEKYKCKNLCISGGCGMNSVANGKIKELTNFENIYIQPAAGDAGGAIGAAFSTYYKFEKKPKKFLMNHSYWGNFYNDDYIKNIIQKNISSDDTKYKKLYFKNNNDLCKFVAKLISEKKIVGWFQGKMEWGPRALGNRSIIADPRSSEMRDVLNLKIKRRESFRPFAPSILTEDVKNWFEIDDKVPFMMKVYKIKKSRQKLIPAVTHVDGSGRLQTVEKDTNNIYYNLILEFKKITNIPLVLNTSFNENEPIVRKPDEALNCFLRTKMDVLVLGGHVIIRK